MRLNRNGVFGAAIVALSLIAAACTGSGGDSRPTITVSSFDFGESVILAEIYAQVLEANDYPVEKNLRLGNRELVKPALERGEIDIVPEYVGTLLNFLGGTPSGDGSANHAEAKRLFEQSGVTLYGISPAQDQNALVVTKEFSDLNDVTITSDLAAIASDLKFGAPAECPQREFCAIGLKDVYGIEFGELVPLDFGPRIEALRTNAVDVALLFSTDATIFAEGWVVLVDDMALQPAENIAPAVNLEIADAYGSDLQALLDDVSRRITTEGLTELNFKEQVENQDPEDIARAWLIDQGLISG